MRTNEAGLPGVQVVGPTGAGPWSSVARHTTMHTSPGPPGELRVVAMTRSSLTVAWDTAADHGRAVDRYVLEYMPQDGACWLLAMSDLQVSCEVPGLAPGQFYTFRVRADNAVRSQPLPPFPASHSCASVWRSGRSASRQPNPTGGAAAVVYTPDRSAARALWTGGMHRRAAAALRPGRHPVGVLLWRPDVQAHRVARLTSQRCTAWRVGHHTGVAAAVCTCGPTTGVHRLSSHAAVKAGAGCC